MWRISQPTVWVKDGFSFGSVAWFIFIDEWVMVLWMLCCIHYVIVVYLPRSANNAFYYLNRLELFSIEKWYFPWTWKLMINLGNISINFCNGWRKISFLTSSLLFFWKFIYTFFLLPSWILNISSNLTSFIGDPNDYLRMFIWSFMLLILVYVYFLTGSLWRCFVWCAYSRHKDQSEG
jgi:hypothetical protein